MKNSTVFKDLGTLKVFCEKFGDFTVSIKDINEHNIQLILNSNQEIEFRILCSNALSEIIRKNNGLPEDLFEYSVLKITENDRSYIRISQARTVEGDPNLSICENMEKFKEIPGCVSFSFKIDDIKSEPFNPIKIDDFFKE